MKVVCHNCKEEGHFKRDCINPKVLDCWNCGLLGHTGNTCPTKQASSIGRQPQTQRIDNLDRNRVIDQDRQQERGPEEIRVDKCSYATIAGGLSRKLDLNREAGLGGARNCFKVLLEVDSSKKGKLTQMTGVRIREILGGKREDVIGINVCQYSDKAVAESSLE